MNVSKPGSAKAITAGSNAESSTSCFPERKVDACVFALWQTSASVLRKKEKKTDLKLDQCNLFM